MPLGIVGEALGADFIAAGTNGRGNRRMARLNFIWPCEHGGIAANSTSVTGGIWKSNCISYAAIALGKFPETYEAVAGMVALLQTGCDGSAQMRR